MFEYSIGYLGVFRYLHAASTYPLIHATTPSLHLSDLTLYSLTHDVPPQPPSQHSLPHQSLTQPSFTYPAPPPTPIYRTSSHISCHSHTVPYLIFSSLFTARPSLHMIIHTYNPGLPSLLVVAGKPTQTGAREWVLSSTVGILSNHSAVNHWGQQVNAWTACILLYCTVYFKVQYVQVILHLIHHRCVIQWVLYICAHNIYVGGRTT